MRLLLDENVSNKIKEGLIELGLEEIKHINDVKKGLSDNEVFELAKNEQRIIVTCDDDFKANKFKYKLPIIWITPKGRKNIELAKLIKWIINNCNKYNIKKEKAFITIKKDEYFIEYKNKDGLFGKIKTKQISFNKIKSD